MKKKVFNLCMFFLMATTVAFAGIKTEKFKVKGNCGMCEKRIEKAAISVEGVQSAEWNNESKMIEVKFDDSKTSTGKIEMAIAKVGHDTPHHKVKDEVYNELPGCCKYDRTAEKTEHSHEGHRH
jgi:periplasmic mercuric ion binding protein